MSGGARDERTLEPVMPIQTADIGADAGIARRVERIADGLFGPLGTDARIQRIWAGTNEIMKEIIARSLFA